MQVWAIYVRDWDKMYLQGTKVKLKVPKEN